MKRVLLFAINVDWYFSLHWKARLKSQMVSGFDTYLCLSETKRNNWGGLKFRRIALSRSSVGIWNNLKTFFSAIKVFREVHPTAIHSVTVKPNIMFGLLALVSRKPILITIPGLGSVFSASKKTAVLVQALLLGAYWLISKNGKAYFVFENRSDLNLFRRKGICTESNGMTVPGSGVDTKRFRYTELKRDDKGPLKILFAARLLKNKGLYNLVSVVSELKQEGVPVTLSVAGLIDDDTREAIPLSQVKAWHREGIINWLGQVDDVERHIADSHVIALPTTYAEGLPRILLEANACGRPVIATDVPGCHDFVKDACNGLLVGANDSRALKQAILQMRNRDFCARLGNNGRKLVQQAYTEDHVIDCYRKIYQLNLK